MSADAATGRDAFDVVVVGAGFGGSACAALLARAGLRVCLLDKNQRPGGKAMTVSANGFTHELWPIIHAPAEGSVCETVLERLGARHKLEILKPVRQGATYIDAHGRCHGFPHDRTPDPVKIFDVLGVPECERAAALEVLGRLTLMGGEEIATLDDTSFTAWLARHRVPQPVYSFLVGISNGIFMVPPDQLAASEAIQTIQEMFLGGGGFYCRGGLGRLAEVFAESVEEHGGTVLLRTRVRRIVVAGAAVRGVETEREMLAAPLVVSNAGLQPTVLTLVGERHFEPAYVRYVRALRPSLGMMGVRYFLDAPLLAEPYYMIFSDRAYWTADRWRRAQAGEIARDVILWIEVPANFDPTLAPPGKQAVLTGVWCDADPRMGREAKEVWWAKIDEMMARLWPDFMAHVEARTCYDTAGVSALTRDPTVPGTGGECIGLGQYVGQCGRHKPAAAAPLAGLFFVGTDAGGRGCGTHQAVDSGLKVADSVLAAHRCRTRP